MTKSTQDIAVGIVAPLEWKDSDHPTLRHSLLADVPGHDYHYEVQPGSQIEVGREDFVVTRSHSSRTILASGDTRTAAMQAAQRIHQETVAATLVGAKTIAMEKLNALANEAVCLPIMSRDEADDVLDKLHDYVLELRDHLDPPDNDPENDDGGMTP